VYVGEAIEERDDQAEARLENAVEFAEPLDDVGALLRDDPHSFHDERDHCGNGKDPKRVPGGGHCKTRRNGQHERDDELYEHRDPPWKINSAWVFRRHSQRIAMGRHYVHD
jgi:hypothetical protein